MNVALATASRAACAVAEILGKGGVVLLHSARRTTVAVAHRAVDHIKATLSLIQAQLVVGLQSGVSKIDSAVLDVEDPVGRSARSRGVNAAGAARIPRAASPTQIIRA